MEAVRPGASSEDPFEAAVRVVRGAADEAIPLRLLGGQAIRLLCPDFPARARGDQDMDFATVTRARTRVVEFLRSNGFEEDKRFNALHGHRQMYFRTPEGRTVDVVLDQLRMCHVLDFADRIDRMPHTLDVTDLLLSKLQIVEMNRKDLQDILYLLAAFELRDGDPPMAVALGRIGEILANDWGWWRTVTRNLDAILKLSPDELDGVVPAASTHDPIEQARTLRRHADGVPKSVRWRLRARVGERLRWYDLPEEVKH
jgi:hypothetical protein